MLAACGGAIAPTGSEGDAGGGGADAPSSSSGSASGSSSGVLGGSSASGSSSGFTGSSSSSGGSEDATIDATSACANGAPPLGMTGSAGCDQCVASFCDDSWCACAGDSSVGDAGSLLDDAGAFEGCLGFVSCVSNCLYNGDPDAGLPSNPSVQQCAGLCGPDYTAQQQQEGAALLSCVVSSCNTPSTCGQ